MSAFVIAVNHIDASVTSETDDATAIAVIGHVSGNVSAAHRVSVLAYDSFIGSVTAGTEPSIIAVAGQIVTQAEANGNTTTPDPDPALLDEVFAGLDFLPELFTPTGDPSDPDYLADTSVDAALRLLVERHGQSGSGGGNTQPPAGRSNGDNVRTRELWNRKEIDREWKRIIDADGPNALKRDLRLIEFGQPSMPNRAALLAGRVGGPSPHARYANLLRYSEGFGLNLGPIPTLAEFDSLSAQDQQAALQTVRSRIDEVHSAIWQAAQQRVQNLVKDDGAAGAALLNQFKDDLADLRRARQEFLQLPTWQQYGIRGMIIFKKFGELSVNKFGGRLIEKMGWYDFSAARQRLAEEFLIVNFTGWERLVAQHLPILLGQDVTPKQVLEISLEALSLVIDHEIGKIDAEFKDGEIIGENFAKQRWELRERLKLALVALDFARKFDPTDGNATTTLVNDLLTYVRREQARITQKIVANPQAREVQGELWVLDQFETVLVAVQANLPAIAVGQDVVKILKVVKEIATQLQGIDFVIRPAMAAQVKNDPDGDEVPVVGTAQSTIGDNSANHVQQINNKVDEMVASGDYAYITLNRSWRTATGRGDDNDRSSLRPDIIGVRKDGKVDAFEIRSPTDQDPVLFQRLEDGMNSLPLENQGDFDVIGGPPP